MHFKRVAAVFLALALTLSGAYIPARAAETDPEATPVVETDAAGSEEIVSEAEEPEEIPEKNQAVLEETEESLTELEETAEEEPEAPSAEEASVEEDQAEDVQPETEDAEEPSSEILPDTIITVEVEESTYISGGNGADNDELFAGYVDKAFGKEKTASGRKKLKASAYSRLTGQNAAVYEALKPQIEAVAAGESASTIFTVSLEALGLAGRTWSAEDLGVDAILVDGQISDAASKALGQFMTFDSSAVVNALLADCPYELYWFDKTSPTNSGYSVSAGYAGGEEFITFGSDPYFRFPVAEEYADENGAYLVDTSTGETVRTAASNARAVVNAYQSYPDYEKLDAYREYICGVVDYNDEAAEDDDMPYGNPWQLIWVFDGDETTNVVCEGYSKAFQYLCDLSEFASKEIGSILVTGGLFGYDLEEEDPEYWGGNHMWNVVTMEDGNHYLADITNCDAPQLGADRDLFLIGMADDIDTDEASPYFNESYYYRELKGQRAEYYYDADTRSTFSASDLRLAKRDYSSDNQISPWLLDYSYEIEGDRIVLMSYLGSQTSVTVPSTAYIGTDTYNEVEFRKNVWDNDLVSLVLEEGVIFPEDSMDLFNGFSSLKTFECSGVDTSEVVDMSFMFKNCESLTSLDLSSFDTLKVFDISSMFAGCTSLKTLDISSFDLSAVTSSENFLTDTAPETILTPQRTAGEALPLPGYYQDEDNSLYTSIPADTTGSMEFTKTCAAQIVSASVNFKGTIGLNYFIYIPEEILEDSNAYIEYLVDKTTPETVRLKISDLATEVRQNRECRKVTVNTVMKSINDQITLYVYDGNGNRQHLLSASGKDITKTGFVYSVVRYCDNIAAQSSNEKMKDLAYKLKQYGFYVQKYLNYKADEVTPDLDVSIVTEDMLNAFKGSRTAAIEGLTFSGFSFLFKEDSAIRYKFTLASGRSIDEFSFTVDGKPVTPFLDTGKYTIEVGNIRARDLGTEYVVKVTDGAGNSQTLSYSGLTYARTLIKQGSTEEAKNAARALFLYYEAAVAYFGS